MVHLLRLVCSLLVLSPSGNTHASSGAVSGDFETTEPWHSLGVFIVMEGEECPSQHPEHPQDTAPRASVLHLSLLTLASYHPTRKFSSGILHFYNGTLDACTVALGGCPTGTGGTNV